MSKPHIAVIDRRRARRRSCSGRQGQSGFTLIELMIVVVIAGVVAVVAIPMYSEHVTRGRLAEAMGNLPELRTKVEQHFQDNRSYTGFTLPAVPNARYFTYSLSATATTYTITASGVVAQGTGNFGYTINHANSRTTTALPTGWSGVNSTCWVTRKGGAC